jgi:hypothetical protein
VLLMTYWPVPLIARHPGTLELPGTKGGMTNERCPAPNCRRANWPSWNLVTGWNPRQVR